MERKDLYGRKSKDPTMTRNKFYLSYSRLLYYDEDNVYVKCYKLIGYPPEWPSSKKKRVFANQVGSYGNSKSGVNCSNDFETSTQCNRGTTQSNAGSHGSLPPYFTQEQYTQIIQMLSKASRTFTTMNANTAGCYLLLHLYFLLEVYSGIGEATTRLFAQYRSSSSTSKVNKAEPSRHPSLHRFAVMCNAT
ncbi:hypothetical protein H5410_016469 [Solanum commersonii]|uniref:Uncharacterized protein n=1 Tax=Solanum commersonii TaxID=4109 RepID=A0A9J5ZWB7_SOLCO|nr:hypothetical protein H5410_016469 [Solanum commersonii]